MTTQPASSTDPAPEAAPAPAARSRARTAPRQPATRSILSTYTAFARPTFLYVMDAMILWAIPLGVISAFRPEAARAMTDTMTAYFAALPEELYALFAAAYLGYTAARQWGKAQGSDR